MSVECPLGTRGEPDWHGFRSIITIDSLVKAHKRRLSDSGEQFIIPGISTTALSSYVPPVGLEPTSLSATDFKSVVYANSTIGAYRIKPTRSGALV